MIFKIAISVILFLPFLTNFYDSYESTDFKDEAEFLDTLQYRSFLFFINEINEDLGLVKDRNADWSPASIASMGFALPVWAIGAEKGWINRDYSAKLTLNMLKFLTNSLKGTDKFATGYKGLFYHFLDIKNGTRTWDCELSTIDSGLLFAGLLFARQYYNREDSSEVLIRALTNKIFEGIDWNYFVIPNDSEKHPNSLSMGWFPEKGLINHGWVGFNEALILYIIAAGSGLNDIDKVYNSWLSGYRWKQTYEGLEPHFVFPPMFGHQYSHLFVDFRGIYDSKNLEKGIDYFENSRRAVKSQQRYCIENMYGWKGYDSLIWGITACDGPGETFNFNDKKFLGYAGRGAAGPDFGDNYFDDGTIAPTAVAGSIPFAPEICIPTLINMYNLYGKRGLWGKYGFVDSFNPTLNWFNSEYIGIDQGPIVLMIENYRNDFVWKYVMKDPIIIKGLKNLNFKEM